LRADVFRIDGSARRGGAIHFPARGTTVKFRIDQRFEGTPVEAAIEFLTEEYVFDATKLPNVKGSKLIEEKITPERKNWKNEWCAHGQIPRLVQHIITPKMLT
jgi:hypothetical protein